MHGFLMATVNIAGFAYAYLEDGSSYAQATAFYVTTFAQLFFSFACRSQRYTLPQLGVFTNPYLLAAIVISGILQISLVWFPLTQNVLFKTGSPIRLRLVGHLFAGAHSRLHSRDHENCSWSKPAGNRDLNHESSRRAS